MCLTPVQGHLAHKNTPPLKDDRRALGRALLQGPREGRFLMSEEASFAGGGGGDRRRCTLYTLHPTPYTLHPTPYILHPALHTLRPTPYTLPDEDAGECADATACPSANPLNPEPGPLRVHHAPLLTPNL